MIRAKLQTALDNSLYSKGIYSYWGKKTEAKGENKDEYIVYTTGGETAEIYADNQEVSKVYYATVVYYYRDTMLESISKRKIVKEHEELIKTALINAGFELPYGSFDAQDGTEYRSIIFECEYWVVV